MVESLVAKNQWMRTDRNNMKTQIVQPVKELMVIFHQPIHMTPSRNVYWIIWPSCKYHDGEHFIHADTFRKNSTTLNNETEIKNLPTKKPYKFHQISTWQKTNFNLPWFTSEKPPN